MDQRARNPSHYIMEVIAEHEIRPGHSSKKRGEVYREDARINGGSDAIARTMGYR